MRDRTAPWCSADLRESNCRPGKSLLSEYVHQMRASRRGAKLVVDGRGHTVPGHEEGFFLGGSLFDDVKPIIASLEKRFSGRSCRLSACLISRVRLHSLRGRGRPRHNVGRASSPVRKRLENGQTPGECDCTRERARTGEQRFAFTRATRASCSAGPTTSPKVRNLRCTRPSKPTRALRRLSFIR